MHVHDENINDEIVKSIGDQFYWSPFLLIVFHSRNRKKFLRHRFEPLKRVLSKIKSKYRFNTQKTAVAPIGGSSNLF